MVLVARIFKKYWATVIFFQSKIWGYALGFVSGALRKDFEVRGDGKPRFPQKKQKKLIVLNGFCSGFQRLLFLRLPEQQIFVFLRDLTKNSRIMVLMVNRKPRGKRRGGSGQGETMRKY